MTQQASKLPYPKEPPFIDVRARDWGSIFGLGLVAVTLVSLSPSLPIASLVVLGVAGVVTSAPLAFVLGQLALIPVLSGLSPAVGVAQLGLLAVLTERARSSRDTTTLMVTSLGWVALIALVVGTSEQGMLITGGLLALAVAGSVYLTYRVTLVRLDLVTPAEPADNPDSETKG
ncbi:hypothetical protein [Halorubrum sp. AS12]|uniref:hypothetical protein n=1 Tax=Halorubrum sp. AS12 TaxID=3409687 RepID=UPI003DA75484